MDSGVKLSENCPVDVGEVSSRRKKQRRVGGVGTEPSTDGTEPSTDGTELHVLEKQCAEYKATERGTLKHNRFTVHAGTAVGEVAEIVTKNHEKKGKRRKYGSIETVQ